MRVCLVACCVGWGLGLWLMRHGGGGCMFCVFHRRFHERERSLTRILRSAAHGLYTL